MFLIPFPLHLGRELLYPNVTSPDTGHGDMFHGVGPFAIGNTVDLHSFSSVEGLDLKLIAVLDHRQLPVSVHGRYHDRHPSLQSHFTSTW